MIEVDKLRKEFKKVEKDQGLLGSIKGLLRPKYEIIAAVDNVSFNVPEGEILGFIGPNGAGKSTVIKMLTGILTPTSGKCTINGRDPVADRKKYVKDIGVVFGQRTQLWWDLPLRETYGVLKEIYEVDDEAYKKKMSFLNEVLELDGFITSPVRTLSLGQRMRADIAASLLHSPKVLFLDEPTIGLDVVVKNNIRNAIQEINKTEHTTVILTTHDISDIELLCDRIVMIDKGKKVYDGSLEDMKIKYGVMREICFVPENSESFSDKSFKAGLDLSGEDLTIEKEHGKYRIRFNSDKISTKDMLSYTLANTEAKDISVGDADIEEIIRRLYKSGIK